jgi:hypothetical protein
VIDYCLDAEGVTLDDVDLIVRNCYILPVSELEGRLVYQDRTGYRLLREFEALTGVPVLINTSFNVKGEPIVETPDDAPVCFLTTGIDHLVLHDRLISKNALHRIVGPLRGVYSDVAAMLMASARPA